MPANEDSYIPADETVYEVWSTVLRGGDCIIHEWRFTQSDLEEAKSVIYAVEDDAKEWGDKILSIDIYETTRRRVGGKAYEAPGEAE